MRFRTYHEFSIGLATNPTYDTAGARAILGSLERDDAARAASLVVVVANNGEVPFTISVKHADDNVTYAAIQVRHRAALVNDIVVQPGARVVCMIEHVPAAADPSYYRFQLADDEIELGARGYVQVGALFGTLKPL